MNRLIIEGIPPWDGQYDFPDFGLTNDELYRVKIVSRGLRAGELLDALDANDTAAFVGFATAILERHGKGVDPEDLWKASVGSIRIELGVDDALPPTQPQSDGSSSGNATSSGAGS